MTDRVQMPSGMGGLVRYFDEYKSRIQLKPEYIVLFVIALLAFEIIVRI